jgi:general L-amino acid transport system permease protein
MAQAIEREDLRPPTGGWGGRLPEPRSLAVQVLIATSIVAVIWFLVDNTMENLRARGATTGFAFLWRITSLPIADTWLDYTAGVSTYGRAILVGLLNTLTVSFIVIVLSTVLGTFVGIARLSPNWLLARACRAYVEVLRNVPVLLQLLFWYQLLLQLPAPRRAPEVLDGFLISNRGLRFPALQSDPAHLSILLALLAGVASAFILARFNRLRRERTGRGGRVWPLAALLIIAPPVVAAWATGAGFAFEKPELAGFDFRGGSTLTPELSALVIGLTIYTSAFVAEIVRAGILGVSAGQWEAANALGLRKSTMLRKVVLPQALRIIVPPLGSEYLGVVKNSSLAVAVGYPDLVAVITTMQSDTGQAVEGVLIIMVAYLTISLAVSWFMNWYNRRVALVTR